MSKYTSGAREPYITGDDDSLPYATNSTSMASTDSYSDDEGLTHEECEILFTQRCDLWLSLNGPAILQRKSSSPVAIKDGGPKTPFKVPYKKQFVKK